MISCHSGGHDVQLRHKNHLCQRLRATDETATRTLSTRTMPYQAHVLIDGFWCPAQSKASKYATVKGTGLLECLYSITPRWKEVTITGSRYKSHAVITKS